MTSLKGGKGSGNFGHKGRPGERGGSSSVRIGEGIRSGNSMYSLDAGIAYSGLDNIDVPSLKDDEIYLVRFSTAREDISGKVGLFAYGGKHLDDVINATQAYADRAGGKGYLIIGRYSDPDWDIPLEQESDGVEVNSVLGTEFAPIDLVVPVSLRSSTKSLLPLIIRSALVLDQRGRLDSETKVRVLKALESSWNLEKKSGSATDGHNAAGLLVASRETGRVLMIQRALDETDPHSGEWEFPGGRIEPGETPLEAAKREWMEETGYQLPQGRVVGTWNCGGYTGYVYSVGLEGDIQGLRDQVINPDDPDGDKIEALAWWDVDQLRDNPAVREEVRANLPLTLSALENFELKGGKGSGNFGHAGRPGERGGSGMSSRQAQAFQRYQGASFSTMNGILRGTERQENVPEFISQDIAELTSLIDRSSLQESGEVYRGFSLRPEEIDHLENRGEFRDLGFVSTTTIEKLAYGKAYDVDDRVGIFAKISYPAGVHGFRVLDQKTGEFTGEKEIIFQRGTRFRVISVDRQSTPIRLDLEVIPTETTKSLVDFTPDLALWEKRVLHLLDQGRKPNPRPFKSDTIPEEIKSLIEDGLELVQTKGDVKSLFEFVKGGKGSGNFGHRGRPGERGGSPSRLEIPTGSDEVYEVPKSQPSDQGYGEYFILDDDRVVFSKYGHPAAVYQFWLKYPEKFPSTDVTEFIGLTNSVRVKYVKGATYIQTRDFDTTTLRRIQRLSDSDKLELSGPDIIWSNDRVSVGPVPEGEFLSFKFVTPSGEVKSIELKGGEGSGNFGHKGRPGEVGGSSSSKLDPFDEKDETFFSDWIRESWDTFSYDEQMAFEAYGDGHYREINSLLRSGEYRDGRGETDTQIERMLEAMYRSPAPENFVVYRGTNLSINLDDPDPRRVQLLELLDSKIADPDVEVLFSDQGFLSTSVSRSAADSFYATGKVESDIAGVPIKTIHALRLTIHVPKGMPVAPIYNSEYSDELEVLLPPGQQFRVTSISRKLSPLSSLPDSPKTPAYHYELVLEVAP